MVVSVVLVGGVWFRAGVDEGTGLGVVGTIVGSLLLRVGDAAGPSSSASLDGLPTNEGGGCQGMVRAKNARAIRSRTRERERERNRSIER